MNDNEKIIELMRIPQSTLIQHYLYLEKKIEKLKAEIKLLDDNNNYLNNRIDKTIEYIKENCYDYDYETYSSLAVIDLLEILKGEDK